MGGIESPPNISRDGRQIAFVARALDGRTLLWVRPLATLTARPLPGAEDAAPASVFWSPDGFSLAFIVPGASETGRRSRRNRPGTPPTARMAGAGARGRKERFYSCEREACIASSANGGLPHSFCRRAVTNEFFSDINFLPDGRHFVVLTRHKFIRAF